MRALLPKLGHGARLASRGLAAAAASLGIASLVLTTACYTYDVRAANDIPAGQQVVVTLNNRGRVALIPEIGDDAATLEGNLVSASADSVRMRLTHVSYLSGTAGTYGGLDVAIPRDGMTVSSTKQFSRAKTTALVVIAAAALIGAIGAFGLGGLGGSGTDGKVANPPANQ